MFIILLGAPGAGKGTQAKKIVKEYDCLQLSTGDLLRGEISKNSNLGIEAKNYLDSGDLVPDSLIIKMIENKVSTTKRNGIIFDGFPRTTVQAESFDKMLKDFNLEINYVINIDVKDELVIKRLTGRRVCKKCGWSFHIDYSPSTKGDICDKCGGEIYQRSDDNINSIKNRLGVYYSSTKPLVKFYKNKELLKNIDGNREVEAIWEDIKTILDNSGGTDA